MINQNTIKRFLATAIFLSIPIAMADAQVQTEQKYSEKALSAYNFTDAIGINAQPFRVLNHKHDLDFCTNILAPALRDLGIAHLRTNAPWSLPKDPANNPDFVAFNCALSAGARLLLTITLQKDPGLQIGYSENPAAGGHTELIPDLKNIITYLGVKNIDAIEGVNEYYHANYLPIDEWQSNLLTYSGLVYHALKSDPGTESVKIIGPSLNGEISTGPYSGIVDEGNMHFYDMPYDPSQNEVQAIQNEYKNLEKTVTAQSLTYGDKHKEITETGFSNCTISTEKHSRNYYSSQQCVPEDVAAKNIGRQLLRYFVQGYSRIYIYQLIDHGPDITNREDNFGLLTFSEDDTKGSTMPKPVYYALRNLMHILKDTDTDTKTGSLDFSLSGDLGNIKHVLLEKSDGSFYLAIWQALDSSPSPNAVAVQLTLTNPSNIQIYASLTSENPISSASNVKTIGLSVPDYVMIIKIVPITQ